MSVIDSALAQVKALQPYIPGKPVEELERELGIRNAIKLASNENPLGYSPRVRDVLLNQLDHIAFYPDANAYYLKQSLAQKLGLKPNQLTIGNGSNDVLDLVARTFLTQDREAIFSQYAFLVYPLVIQACGATACVAPALGRDHSQPYGHDLEAMLQRITSRTSIIFIANPNNPTGTWLQQDELYAFLQKVPEHIVVVIDEAYFEYVQFDEYPDSTRWLGEFPNLVVTRTFSKIYGLAGLRLGYAMSSPEVCDLLNRVRQPFNANSLALAAAVESLRDEDFVRQSIDNNLLGLENLTAFCQRKQLFFIPSAGNFLTIEFAERTAEIHHQLQQQGIIVRPVANYQLDGFLRISIGSPSQMTRLTEALESLL